ncbi:hypothetical protein NPIL_557221 [Nephila pilipes]|uniref:Uncharacterized protein n=1 Tax=Nephila pilipes TaxID=299642 RepID=A0A8X6PBZ7_NEPPI|nr:hypothetical protein NPIL_557221 [Nephila pilipes]
MTWTWRIGRETSSGRGGNEREMRKKFSQLILVSGKRIKYRVLDSLKESFKSGCEAQKMVGFIEEGLLAIDGDIVMVWNCIIERG